MRILVIGVSFKNKGAEAMALTIVKQSTLLFQDVEIVLASYAKNENKAYGKHILSNGEIFRLIANDRSLDRPLRLLVTLFFPQKLSRKICLKNKYLNELSSADIIIDASGYALSNSRPLHRQIMYALEIYAAKYFKKPFYVFTQSFGPFTPGLRHILVRCMLNHVSLISCRGKESKKAINQLRLSKESRVINASDMTYLFDVSDDYVLKKIKSLKKTKGLLVGIVPNINLYRRTKGKRENNVYINMLIELIKYLVSKLKVTPIVVCHEHYAFQEDDQWLSEILHEQVKPFCDLEIISAEHSAEELKATIGSLDFIIASRFHSIVAAISKETPFLAIGWSHKYHDLVNEIDLPLSALDGRNLTESDAIERFKTLWDDRENIKQKLSCKQTILKDQAMLPFLELRDDLKP